MGFTSILTQKPQSSQQGKNGKGQNVFGLLLAALRGGAKHTISSALIKPSSPKVSTKSDSLSFLSMQSSISCSLRFVSNVLCTENDRLLEKLI